MGFSGFKGRVYVINEHCPVVDNYGDVTAPSATAVIWTDEVTGFTVTDSAKKDEYGHDKSAGWQDVVYGTRRLGITLTAVSHRAEVNPGGFHSGQILFLELWPFGRYCTNPAKGYAGVDQVSYQNDIRDGRPVGYTMTLSSKLEWAGMPGGNQTKWGGFECAPCDTSEAAGSALGSGEL